MIKTLLSLSAGCPVKCGSCLQAKQVSSLTKYQQELENFDFEKLRRKEELVLLVSGDSLPERKFLQKLARHKWINKLHLISDTSGALEIIKSANRFASFTVLFTGSLPATDIQHGHGYYAQSKKLIKRYVLRYGLLPEMLPIITRFTVPYFSDMVNSFYTLTQEYRLPIKKLHFIIADNKHWGLEQWRILNRNKKIIKKEAENIVDMKFIYQQIWSLNSLFSLVRKTEDNSAINQFKKYCQKISNTKN